MKWINVKTQTLKKMFSNDTAELVIDDTTLPYLNAMPDTANECLAYIATAVRHIDTTYTIEQDGTEKGIKRYDLKELVPDFFMLHPEQVYFSDGTNYGQTYDFKTEHNDVIILDGSKKGTWTVYVDVYPTEITEATPDDYELPLYPEVARLLPHYMAAELYKDDDPSIAGTYWNEFVAMLEAAKETAKMLRGNGLTDFVNTKGWY